MENERNFWTGSWKRRVSRRQVLRGAGRAGMGLAGLALLGCAAPAAPSPTPKPTGPTPTPGPTYGGNLIGAIQTMPGFDPGFHLSGSWDEALYSSIYNSLFKENADGSLTPHLVESFETPDLTTFVFKLKKGVKFHDGTDFNASVAKAHYERLADKNYTGPQAQPLQGSFKSAEAVDDATFKLVIQKPNSSFLYQCARSQGAGMIAQPNDAKKKNNDLKTGGIGTGPFMANEWLLDDKASVKKFPGYWEKGIPYLDAIVWRRVPSYDVQVTMLKTGEVHLCMVVQTKDVPLIKNDPNVMVKIQPGGKRQTLQFNHLNSPFKEKAIRQAVAYAIDREALTNAVWQGLYLPGDGPFPPASWLYDPNLKGYPFDVAKAKAKMTEGGYPNGFDAKVAVANSRPADIQVAEVAKDMLSKIGIRLDIQVFDEAAWTSIRNTDDKNFQMLISSSGDASDPGNLLEVYYSSRMKIAMAKAKNPQLDTAVEKGQGTYDKEEIRRYFQEAAKIITEDVWSILTLAYPVNIYAYRKGVNGVEVGLNYTNINLVKTWISK